MSPPRSKVSTPGNSILRIEITAARRRRLNRMASEAGKTVDELAAGLLSDLIDDDAKAHGETT